MAYRFLQGAPVGYDEFEPPAICDIKSCSGNTVPHWITPCFFSFLHQSMTDQHLKLVSAASCLCCVYTLGINLLFKHKEVFDYIFKLIGKVPFHQETLSSNHDHLTQWSLLFGTNARWNDGNVIHIPWQHVHHSAHNHLTRNAL